MEALAADILFAAGGVMIAGGVVWVILEPAVPVGKPPAAEPKQGEPVAWTLKVGGTF